jgi:hypothetical protein
LQLSSIPAKFSIPWAYSASGSFIRAIPTASQIGIQNGAASLTDGFPPLNFSPVAAGGVPPFGQDMNGILNRTTAWSQWQSAGGVVPYDASFQTAIGGYPQGAIVASGTTLGLMWQSSVDNNASNPDTGGAGWWQFGSSTGTIQWRPTSENIPGWIIANNSTIGNASSGATQLADASAKNLFVWHWNNFSNTQCPVSGGRGASGAADFAANKTITILDMRGTGMSGVDTMGNAATGRFNGVPVTAGGVSTPGSIIGENLHQLNTGELPVFTPTGAFSGSFSGTPQNWSLSGSFSGTQATWSTNQGSIPSSANNNIIIDAGAAANRIVQANAISTNLTTTITPAGTISGTTGVTPAGSISGSITMNSIGSGVSHNTVSRSMTGYVYIHL